MANVKYVKIQGWIPFHCCDYEPLHRFLAQMNAPSFDLRISYREMVMESNEHGGQTAFYFFTIEGEEAVRTEYLSVLADTLEAAGVQGIYGYALDIENGRARVWEHKWKGVQNGI